jgi:hypothetical protein
MEATAAMNVICFYVYHYVADAHAHVQRLVSVVKMAIVLEE